MIHHAGWCACHPLDCRPEARQRNEDHEMTEQQSTRYEDYGFSSWRDVSLTISDMMHRFLDGTEEQNLVTIREWAADGQVAIRDIRACGLKPQWPAEWYQRWAQEWIEAAS